MLYLYIYRYFFFFGGGIFQCRSEVIARASRLQFIAADGIKMKSLNLFNTEK